jgi:hypothetical protein
MIAAMIMVLVADVFFSVIKKLLKRSIGATKIPMRTGFLLVLILLKRSGCFDCFDGRERKLYTCLGERVRG